MSFLESLPAEHQRPETEIENHQDLVASTCYLLPRRQHSAPQDIEHKTILTLQVRLLMSLQFQRSYCICYFYRSLRVARPNNTSITVMIQKRTMTLGSGKPFNSKW